MPDGRLMTCSVCKHNYHLGKRCSGIAESTFTAMSPDKKEKWRCKVCRSKNNRADLDGVDASSDSISSCESTTLAAQILTVNEKLDSLLSLKASVNLLLELPAKKNELLLLKPTIDLMKVTVEEVQTSISFLGTKYDSLLATVSAHATDMNELRTEVASLKDTVCEQAHTIQSLQTELNDADQRGRQHSMEIHGMTVKPDEALPSILAGLADKLGIPGHQTADVVSVFRLPGKRAIKPPILVKFTSAATKDKWMQARCKLRQLSHDNPPERLYFNGSLTQTNRELFWQARALGKKRGYKFVWVKNARIFARKD
ncbi:uncharacterized protein LOC115330505 [Ixodes scapularis]|uniref:uncharacterized protein LOC115330505 n=1 Tax=Ixodes scapularis TaxID=6945 RepID=UPI001A9D3246|nr:uncharacterized protein LOC115330505 [Ixodes scapularis]